ncbi:hypothetical protein SERLA73DRAFT_151834 [Serpula lacrymans var. lacrymans S7.3]|uniref:Uncharacterized protein n=2 Tax=Serpula lacrymans var. lacrymans TaxID=341189 RepID=F8PT14_SERL3|nr:uncharacterized protein SERLADRAFT_407598 [Serpula lacrymans var. lacrymans S7.9]EGO01389.1 hypothetical protein SERLA73DRAFT_151834 [Serpula lacrymans var. lacrymans S7.3]EGO27020.1 hypothetical protein SERLADRAFT_407598 [Serpula lacrymans var. lacrymans S7.9]
MYTQQLLLIANVNPNLSYGFVLGITVGLAMSVYLPRKLSPAQEQLEALKRMSKSLAAATEVDASCSTIGLGNPLQRGSSSLTDFTFYTTIYTNEAHAAIQTLLHGANYIGGIYPGWLFFSRCGAVASSSLGASFGVW